MPDSIDPATPRQWLLEGNLGPGSADEFILEAALSKVLDQPGRVKVIVSNAQAAVGRYLNSTAARELAAALLTGREVIAGSGPYVLDDNYYRWVVQPSACIDCGHGFRPDSSPHVDRCWACAERDDEESGR